MCDWNDQELYSLALGDQRLNNRLVSLLGALATDPQASLPSACKGRAELVAAYRFFQNDRVSEDGILSPHQDSTILRMKEHPVVLCVQDTTEMDFSFRKMEGAGPLNSEERLGFYNHVSLAITPERLCLGILGAKMWAREQGSLNNDKKARARKPIEAKESNRWIEGYLTACQIQEWIKEIKVINVADREGDIYELFVQWQRRNPGERADWIIRSRLNRSLPEKIKGEEYTYHKLWDIGRSLEVLGQIQFKIKNPKKRARVVTMTLQGGRFTLKPPYRYTGDPLPQVEISLVICHEVDPPEEEEALEWLLLTSLPISNFEQASKVVNFYLCRWQIEIFFKVLKSGCKIEDRQLQKLAAMKRCTALYMIVAWRVLYVAMMGRCGPDLPCTVLFEDAEWKSVWMILKKTKLPKDPPQLGDFVRMVATLGGFLGRKSDGNPGPKHIWIGIQKMMNYATAWEAFGPEKKYDDPYPSE
ncbi:MAG: IS4 family transposase [Candidatus Eisenbacteria bacterium]|nr:IS4 family transposase [Candidatus Eisenbacteria bacterium]